LNAFSKFLKGVAFHAEALKGKAEKTFERFAGQKTNANNV